MNEKNIHYKLCNSQAITKQIIFWTSMEKVYKHCQKIKVIYFLINSQKFNYYKCFETNKNGVFMSWIGGLKDITGSWSASMRVAGSFAIIAASVLAIENVIARFQRRKSSIEKNVQAMWWKCILNSFFYKVPWNRLFVYHTTDVFCC